MTYPTTSQRYGRAMHNLPQAKVCLDGVPVDNWLTYNTDEGWIDVENVDAAHNINPFEPILGERVFGVVTIERVVTDQEHADAIRAAADALDAAIRAAHKDGLNVHVLPDTLEPIACGFIRHTGIKHVEVIRAINPA